MEQHCWDRSASAMALRAPTEPPPSSIVAAVRISKLIFDSVHDQAWTGFVFSPNSKVNYRSMFAPNVLNFFV